MNEALQYLKKYQGLLFFCAMAIVFFIVLFRFIIPKIEEINTLRETIALQKKTRDSHLEYVGYLEELASRTLQVEENIINYALPSENDVVSLIVTYEGLSTFEGVEVSPFELSPGLVRKVDQKERIGDTSIATEEVSEGSPVDAAPVPQELVFEMHVTSENAERAIEFINEINATRRIFNIKSLLWENPEDESGVENELEVGFEIATYYYVQPPKGVASRELVRKGQTQADFIAILNKTKVYEDLVLDGVVTGKEDLFIFKGTQPFDIGNPGEETAIENEEVEIVEEQDAATVSAQVIR